MAITAPYEGDEDGRGHNISVLVSPAGQVSRSGVVPPDVEEAIAFGAAHAHGAFFEARAVAAVRAHAIAGAPRLRQPCRVRWARHDGPPGGRRRQDFEGGAWHGRRCAVHVEHDLARRQAYD